MKKRGEEKKKRRRRRRRREEKKEEGRIKKSKCMEKYGFLYGKVWIFVWKNQTINPFFYFYFYEIGSKRTLLGILVVFGSFRLDLELFWIDIVNDLGLYGKVY